MAKPYYAKEFKKYALREARKPQEGYPLSGVAVVLEGRGKGFCYIRFSSELVTAVGTAMPLGICAAMPCFLKVLHVRKTEMWKVYGVYLDESKSTLLWVSNSRPSWVTKVRSSSDGQETPVTPSGV